MIFLRDVRQTLINFFFDVHVNLVFTFVIFFHARCSPPKQSVVPVHARNDYPTQAVQKTHDKLMPSHEMKHTSTKPTIHQPRK